MDMKEPIRLWEIINRRDAWIKELKRVGNALKNHVDTSEASDLCDEWDRVVNGDIQIATKPEYKEGILWRPNMKGEITQCGKLEIERAGKLKAAGCPFNDVSCGDWCPLFDDDAGRIGANETVMLRCSPNGKKIEVIDKRLK